MARQTLIRSSTSQYFAGDTAPHGTLLHTTFRPQRLDTITAITPLLCRPDQPFVHRDLGVRRDGFRLYPFGQSLPTGDSSFFGMTERQRSRTSSGCSARRNLSSFRHPLGQRRRVQIAALEVGGPSGLRKTTITLNSLAHRTTWLRSDFLFWDDRATAVTNLFRVFCSS